MKTFYYPLGHEAGKTMTVEELILKLAQYPHDMPVFGAWEGVCGYVEPENFSVETMYPTQGEKCACLLIDVNKY